MYVLNAHIVAFKNLFDADKVLTFGYYFSAKEYSLLFLPKKLLLKDQM